MEIGPIPHVVQVPAREQTRKTEVRPLNRPEVLANAPTENLAFLWSIPVYKEWSNGKFLQHIHGVLSQKVQEGTSIEANYLINLGEEGSYLFREKDGVKRFTTDFIDTGESDFYLSSGDSGAKEQTRANVRDSYEEAIHTRQFIQTLIEAQRISRILSQNKNKPGFLLEKHRAGLSALLAQEHDPLAQEILRLAVEKADRIAISGVDMTRVDLEAENISFNPKVDTSQPQWWENEEAYAYAHINDNNMGPMARIRTQGMYYGYHRLPTEDGIFMLSDGDTVPQSNTFVQGMLTLYATNPYPYLFSNYTFQPPGMSQEIAAKAHTTNLDRTGIYTDLPASPQISFRKGVMQQMALITGLNANYFHRWEDLDTGKRLLALFGNIDGAQLLAMQGSPLPIVLTSLRSGAVDGFGSLADIKQGKVSEDIQEGAKKILNKRNGLIRSLEEIPDGELKRKIIEELAQTRIEYTHDAQVQLRFNRRVVKDFLSLWEKEIRVADGQIQVNEQAVLAMQNGSALLHYINQNKNLLASLSTEDITATRYFVGMDVKSEDVPQQLTPFQQAMREYLGEYTSFAGMFAPGTMPQNENTQVAAIDAVQLAPRDSNSRQSYYFGLVTETLALASVFHKYIQSTEMQQIYNKPSGYSPETNLEIMQKVVDPNDPFLSLQARARANQYPQQLAALPAIPRISVIGGIIQMAFERK